MVMSRSPLKVSVVTITWRPGYIATLVQALWAQTLPKDQFEWILVDDLWEKRRDIVADYVGDSLQLVHIPPREVKPYSATGIAVNTALAHTRGQVAYFMSDYVYPHPHCLERHWYIHQRYGLKCLVIGPILDRVTMNGQSVWTTGAKPVTMTIQVGEKAITYPEHLPPIELDLRPDWQEVKPENYLSTWTRPFSPTWPTRFPLDWRIGYVMFDPLDVKGRPCVSLEPHLLEGFPSRQWWWASRNDSAPVAEILRAGGAAENPEQHGGVDADLCKRMRENGCRFLIDREAPCIVLPHPNRKPERGQYPTALKIEERR